MKVLDTISWFVTAVIVGVICIIIGMTFARMNNMNDLENVSYAISVNMNGLLYTNIHWFFECLADVISGLVC